MSVLRWDKPKKIRTPKENAEHYGFEDGPTGGYQPNMSEADSRSWKAKLVGHAKGRPQVEIRRQCGPSLLLVIVNLGTGYNYKQYQSDTELDVYKTGAEYDSARIARYENQHRGSSRVDYVKKNPTSDEQLAEMQDNASTRGINVHMSTNGPIQLNFEEFAELGEAVAEAKLFLTEKFS